jgi:leucyl-tRNA synthetase
MDTFVDYSWYYLRYCDPRDTQKMVDQGASYWMPMDQYIGGIEHAILHLLYARFWTKVMRDLGCIKVDEPFTKLLTQGMVLNHIYSRTTDKGGVEYFWPHEVENISDADGRITHALLKDSKDGLPAGTRIEYEGVGTMSKSKNNGVDPQDLIEKFGADTARLYTMFTAPPEATLEWNDDAVEGSFRFLRRVWAFGAAHHERLLAYSQKHATADKNSPVSAGAAELRFEIHSVLKQAVFDYERMQYNTVVSAAMKMLNTLETAKLSSDTQDDGVLFECFSILLRILYPVCPHIGFSLWDTLGYAQVWGPLLDAQWPKVDPTALERSEIELMLQVNGKLRGSLKVSAKASKEDIETMAVASEAFQNQSKGLAPKKIIVVPGRLVNLVV